MEYVLVVLMSPCVNVSKPLVDFFLFRHNNGEASSEMSFALNRSSAFWNLTSEHLKVTYLCAAIFYLLVEAGMYVEQLISQTRKLSCCSS